MNTQVSKVLLIVVLSAILGVSAGAAVGTFTFRTSGASDTVEAIDLVYPQRVPESDSVTTESIADGSVTNAKLAEPVSVANGGTGKTTAAEGLAALGGASLNGSSTVDFSVKALTMSGLAKATIASPFTLKKREAAYLLADNASATIEAIFGEDFGENGRLEVIELNNGARAGIFHIRGGASPAISTLVADTVFSTIYDNASTVNVYNIAPGTFGVQNKTGGPARLYLNYVGE